MFEETDSVLNNEPISSDASHKSFKTRILLMQNSYCDHRNFDSVKAMLHGAVFPATCNAILLLRDVKLPNTSLHYTPLMFSQHIENSSLISLIDMSQE